MEIILLERIAKLGQLGDIVSVKDGFARNYLLPQGKALRANEANKAKFEAQRADLEAKNEERKTEAESINKKLDGNSYVVIRSAGQTGQLYGSVSSRDIVACLSEAGFNVARSQVSLTQPIKVIGIHDVVIVLHPEVEAIIKVNVARSEDEATRQEAGEDLTAREQEMEFETFSEDDADLEEIFENPEDVDLGESDAEDEEAAAAEPAGEEADEENK